jgi:hypothetical protein
MLSTSHALSLTTNRLFKSNGTPLPTAALTMNLIAITKSLLALMEFHKCTLLLLSLTLSMELIRVPHIVSKFALATLAVLVNVPKRHASINASNLSLLLNPE